MSEVNPRQTDLHNLRPEGKFTQLVKHWKDVAASKKKAFPYKVARKYDGVRLAFIVNGENTKFYTRTGKRIFREAEELLASIMPEAYTGRYKYVMEGELVIDTLSLEEISATLSPNRKKKALTSREREGLLRCNIAVFDCLELSDFLAGFSQYPYYMRREFYVGRVHSLMSAAPSCPLIISEEMECYSEEAILNFFGRVVDEDGEGVVIKNDDAGWEAGHKGFRSMKMVRSINFDLKCTNTAKGKGKRDGQIAKLFFQWKDGQTIKADLGEGWTDDKRASLLTDSPIGKVFRVYAMRISSKGKLRLAKVGEERIDKTVGDY